MTQVVSGRQKAEEDRPNAVWTRKRQVVVGGGQLTL